MSFEYDGYAYSGPKIVELGTKVLRFQFEDGPWLSDSSSTRGAGVVTTLFSVGLHR